jgi:hypothetical protein
LDDWHELAQALADLSASESVEVREDGEWLAGLSPLNCELRNEGKQPLVHLWSSERTLTRRVLGIKERSSDRLVLEVQRFGKSAPGRLEFLRASGSRTKGRISREQFRARFRRLLAEKFPDAQIDSLTAAPDLERSFSGLYVRGKMHEGSRSHAFLAVSPGENSTAIDGILGFGLLWLDWTRSHADRRPVEGLRLFVPQGSSRTLRERLLAISPSARAEVFEFAEPEGHVRAMDTLDAGNLESRLAARRDMESDLHAAGDALARARAALPDSPPGALRVRPANETHTVALCYRGLEFARWSSQGTFFGLGDSREPLHSSTEKKFEMLLREIEIHRNPVAENTNHPLYRGAPERWLEALIQEAPDRLDATLDPAHLYSQVPAMAAGDRGVIDLLGITRRGRLVVIELKASEDIQLPIQAVDYWLRVRRHQQEGNFERYGYFSGAKIDPAPPLVWLVAPGLRFHPATEILPRYFSAEIQLTRIGLNEDWRRGIKVLFRQ